MISRPSAIGSEMPSIWTVPRAVFSPGTDRPSNRPAAIATPIHTGRKRSSVDNLSTTGASGLVVSVTLKIRPPQQNLR